MEYAFAPMEGLTDSIFRRLHHRYFPGVDVYYMPFFSPTIHRTLSAKEQRELPEANSVPFPAVPQVLTKSAPDFLWAARACQERGYQEVNLNLGCPSGTVVAKGKGAGLLREPEALDRFLEEVFAGVTLPVSIKTRIGLESPEEFARLLAVFNQYPLHRLIVHPRVRQQFYAGKVQLEAFDLAVRESRNRLCFNGDIRSLSDIAALERRYPQLEQVMVGRGLLADPGMLSGGTSREALQAFVNELLEEYLAAFGGSRNAMFRLKELWSYLRTSFSGSDKLWKALRKTTDLEQYRQLTAQLLQLPLQPQERLLPL